ncbi:MAG: hypothetical protein A2Z29_00130 [Chloroflexi bacterium RBG_16_56_11]|nr:MAG: hypothetical protein A2Z29_00130 [Chloroflexi bacterium RBG_16_56_11]
MQKINGPRYRWYILGLTMATYGLITGSARLCMPVLFKQISDDLGLSVVAIGTIWGMDPLAGVFIGLPGGLLADRFGVRRMLFVACILAGVFGAMRGLSVNFFTMALAMFLFGITVAATPSIVPKVTTQWFGGKQLGLTNALLNVAWGAGAMIATMFSATVFSPWLGGWRNVLFLYGAPPVLLGILWWFTGREPGKSELPGSELGVVPFRRAFSHVIRSKMVWLIGIINMTLWGASTGYIGYLPLYLRNIGWTPASADSAITVLMGVSTLGVIPMVLLAGRTSQKGVLLFSFAMLALSIALLPAVDTSGVWLLVVAGGFLRSGTFPILNVMVFETKEIGSTYAGTAIGLTSSIGMLGAFISPPLGNNLASFSQGMPLVFWGGLAALAMPFLLLLPSNRRQLTG